MKNEYRINYYPAFVEQLLSTQSKPVLQKEQSAAGFCQDKFGAETSVKLRLGLLEIIYGIYILERYMDR